jgi:poly(A) polymerase
VSDPLVVLATLTDGGWLVGGAVRDRLLGRPTADFDVALADDPRGVARALGKALKAHSFQLSEGFGGWRVVARERDWQVDLLPLAGPTIEEDLAQRDLTINAIAEPLSGGECVDPFGGISDLGARRVRMVSAEAFDRDPLRTLRVARIACELDFAVDPGTVAAASARTRRLAHVAPERVFLELKRIVSADLALQGLELMDRVGATEAVLPELGELREVEQSPYHHLDVYEHTRAVLAEAIALERDPERLLGEYAEPVAALLSEPLANELTRWQALRFGALFHDIAKPQTRDVTAEGRVTFLGHDAAGAQLATAVLQRLRASERLAEYVAALTLNHLRLGFLVHEMPLSRHAVYRYLRACEPVPVDVTLLSVADRLATRGSGSERAIARHLKLANQMLGDALAWVADPPRPPVRGNELTRALGIEPGPRLGRLLAELEEASFAGEVSTRQEAIDRARELLGADR